MLTAHRLDIVPAPRGIDRRRIEGLVRELLVAVGEDPDREGLRRTPERVAQHWAELFAGMDQDAAAALDASIAVCDVGVEEPATSGAILVRDLRFRSVCEHHLLPFAGRAHVAYLPGADVVGFGALVRVVEILAARPQIQERLGEEIAGTIASALRARGVLVVLDAVHHCVTMRAAAQALSSTVTVAARGVYAQAADRAEVMALIGAPHED